MAASLSLEKRLMERVMQLTRENDKLQHSLLNQQRQLTTARAVVGQHRHQQEQAAKSAQTTQTMGAPETGEHSATKEHFFLTLLALRMRLGEKFSRAYRVRVDELWRKACGEFQRERIVAVLLWCFHCCPIAKQLIDATRPFCR
jgi:hypothetical protein